MLDSDWLDGLVIVSSLYPLVVSTLYPYFKFVEIGTEGFVVPRKHFVLFPS